MRTFNTTETYGRLGTWRLFHLLKKMQGGKQAIIAVLGASRRYYQRKYGLED